MASRKQIEISPLLLIGGGAIALFVLFPLIQGAQAVTRTVRDVIQAPGKLFEVLNNDLDNSIFRALVKIIETITTQTQFNPNNTEHIQIRTLINEMVKQRAITAEYADALKAKWDKPIGDWMRGVIEGALKVIRQKGIKPI